MAATLLLAGCSAAPVSHGPVGALGAGFSPASPAPESTITPRPGSWDDVHPGEGYRIVLLTAGDDAPTRAVAAAVTSWAGDEDVTVRTVEASTDPVAGVVDALDPAADLVVVAGTTLVEPLALVSASHLDRHFLLVGAEIDEPTANVTAVSWPGSASRTSPAQDPATFTPTRCGAALRAGVAAVLHDLTGIVVRVD